MLYFVLMMSTLMATGKTIIFKKIGTDSSSLKQLMRLNSLSFLVSTLISFVATGFNVEKIFFMSGFSFLIALLYSLSIIFTYITQTKSMAMGTSSSTILIYSCGFLIPIFFGVIFLNEKISLVQIISIMILVLSLFLVIAPEKNKKHSVKWLFFSLLSMIGSGSTAVIQKIHQNSLYADEFKILLFWTFLFASVILYIISCFISDENKLNKKDKTRLYPSLLSGMFIGLLNLLNLRLAGKLPSVILFPTYNVGSIILSGILCILFFKEKTTKRQIYGFVIGCLAILLIGIF